MGELRVVAGFALQELLRRKVLWLLALAGAGAIALFAYALAGATDAGAMARLPAVVRGQILERMLTSTLMVGTILASLSAVFMGAGAIAAEVESGRVQMVISRPVTRTGVFLGHFAGLAAAVAGFAAAFYLAALVVFGWRTGTWPPGWAAGLAAFPLGALVMLGLTLLLSALAASVAAGVGGFLLLLLAWVGSGVESIGHLARLESLQVAGVLISLLVPGAAVPGWVTEQLRQGLQASMPLQINLAGPAPSGAMVAYAALYLAGTVAAGLAAFRSRDL